MPASFSELYDLWESQEMERKAKRLFIFAPDCEPWTDMVEWTNTFYVEHPLGSENIEVDLETCIRMLFLAI